MKTTSALLLSIALAAGAQSAAADDDRGFKRFRTQLMSYEEVPALSTVARGEFKARINKHEDEIEWELSYADLESDVTQAHIHFGQSGVNGGISVFLCTNLGNGPAGTQGCPLRSGTISGTIGVPDVIGPLAQGIPAEGFGELVRAMRAGVTYANVHTTGFTGGEIRGQIGPGHGRH